jgi:hypothetical protein
MTMAKQFQQQFGGLYTAVIPYEQADPLHRSSLGGVLRDAIKHEAKVHGAAFDHAGFRNVMQAMANGDVEVLFFAAAWDLCEPKIIGATINFPSVSLERKGDDITAKRGIYSEDVCILPAKMKELVLEKPTGGRYPADGIGMHFIRESMRYFTERGMRGGEFPSGQTFEFAPDNSKIVRIQQQLGSRLGKDQDSSLLRLPALTDSIRDKWTMPVEVVGVQLPDGSSDPNNFIIRWAGAGGKQKIEAAFTKGISTFKGTTVTQGQFISNGNLPDAPMVECVLASVLKAADDEIRMRRWGHLRNQPPGKFTPSIPLHENKQQAFRALIQAQNDELFAPPPAKDNSLLFGVTPPSMHIHALNEPELVAGLRSLGAETRWLGTHAMQTASLDLAKAIDTVAPVRSLKLIGAAAVHAPQFTFAA